MTVQNPRSRMISIRLSEDEYSALRRVCLVTGARSVSDLARDAMRVLMNGVKKPDSSAAHLHELRLQIMSLDSKIERLFSEMLEARARMANQKGRRNLVSAQVAAKDSD